MKPIQPIDIFRYYVNYKDIEEPILKALEVNNWNVQEPAFKKFMSYMAIGRNFRPNTQAMVYHTAKNYIMEGNTTDAEELSARFYRGELLSGNTKNARVAASKVLWLFHNRTIIMDNLNRKALKVKEGAGYQEYCDAWIEAFLRIEPEIVALVENHGLANIDPVMKELWFKMRVFDQYLWRMNY